MGIITEEMADGAPPEAQVGTAKRPRKRKRVFQFNVGKHIMITLSKLVPTLLSNPSISNEELRDILLADEMRLVILEGLSPKEKRDVIKGVWTSASDDLVASHAHLAEEPAQGPRVPWLVCRPSKLQ